MSAEINLPHIGADDRDEQGHSHNQQAVMNTESHGTSRIGKECRNSLGQQSATIDHNELRDSLKASKLTILHYVTVEPLAFMAIMALYLEFPAIQDLIYTKICLQVVSSRPVQANQTNDLHTICDRLNTTDMATETRQEISHLNSLFWLKYQILICLLSAISSPYWGGVSDRIGRLIPLNVPIVVAIFYNLISLIFALLISTKWHSFVNVNWLYVGALLVGLSGGQSVLIMNAFSFISDNTTSEQRSRRVTVLESVIFVAHSAGFSLGKAIMLLGLAPPDRIWSNRHFVAFAACIMINLVCILYSACRLRHHTFHKFLNNFEREQNESASMGPDTMATSVSLDGAHADGTFMSASCDRLRELTSSTPADEPSTGADTSIWNSLATLSHYKETFQIAMKPRDTRPVILLLLLAGFISALSLATLMSLLFVYLKSDPFNWSTSQYSSWNANSSITRGVALVSLTVIMKFVPDSLVAAVGFLAKGVGLLMLGLAQSSLVINSALIAFTFSEYSMPPIRSLLSKLVISEELGKIYSCLGGLQNLCFILGNIAFYLAFTSLTDHSLFRMSFFIVGGLELSAIILVVIIHAVIKRQVLIT